MDGAKFREYSNHLINSYSILHNHFCLGIDFFLFSRYYFGLVGEVDQDDITVNINPNRWTTLSEHFREWTVNINKGFFLYISILLKMVGDWVCCNNKDIRILYFGTVRSRSS